MTKDKPLNYIPIVRHLEDKDALKTYGTSDNPIKENQQKEIVNMLSAIQPYITEDSLILTSPCRRAVETATLVKNEYESQGARICIEKDTRISELGKGVLNLPFDYNDGEFFQPLSDAWDIFWQKALVEGDLKYKFGSSVNDYNLSKYFNEPGENYLSYASRIYSFVTDYVSTYKNNKPLVITHSGIARTAMELELLSRNISDDNEYPEPTSIPSMTWQLYGETKSIHQNTGFGSLTKVSTEYLSSPKVIELLRMTSIKFKLGNAAIMAVGT